MFCTECGSENPSDAQFCSKCGRGLAQAAEQYSPASPAQRAPAPALWNPNAAAAWSLLFSPAFGAYLHALNWAALNEPAKAHTGRIWFFVSLGLVAISLFIPVPADGTAGFAVSMGLDFGYWLIWYFAAGRPHAKSVDERLGVTYRRRPWGKALLIATAALISAAILAGTIEFARTEQQAIEAAASCEVGSVQIKEDSMLINNEPDFAYTAYVPLANRGPEQEVRVVVELRTSEGTFSREQPYRLRSGATAILKFPFHEPTINATNVQAVVQCLPP